MCGRHGWGAAASARAAVSSRGARNGERRGPGGGAVTAEGARHAGVEQLAGIVYAYTIPGVIAVNAGIIVGDDAVAVVDTGTTEADARALLRAAASVTERPVRYVVNTHHHGDHSFGNWWFLPAVVVGHARCRWRLVGEQGASHRETLATHLPMLREQLVALPLAPPALTFEQYCDLHLGGVSLRLAYLGRAHTDNDIAVGIDGADVAFAGDLVEESGPPIVGDGYPAEWGPTLRKLGAAAVDRFVPGHGRMVDATFVAAQAEAFEALSAVCAAAGGGAGRAAAALDALPRAVRDVLDAQAPAAVRRYFETASAARA